jgi:fatty-acyl-CoA synthase
MLTEQEVRNFCKDKIAHFKTSRQVIFVDDFPMGVTGRIQKFRIR